MRKNLIAAAVVALVAAPFAAQADTKLSGRGHVSIDSVDNGVDSSTAMSNNSSWLGFDGVEKIGGGLSAIYSLQFSVDGIVDNNTALGNRNQFVGLKGGFGTLIAGRTDTPVKGISRKYDLWGDTLGDSRQFTNVADGGAGFGLRTPNTLAYVSPKIAGGLTATIGYVFDHDITAACAPSRNDDNDCDAMSASLVWDKGMFNAAVGYETHGLAGGAEDESMLRAGLGLKFKPARVNLFYQQSENTGFVANDGRAVMGIGVGVKLGGGELKGQYYIADEFNDVANTDATMYTIGYDYNLSKRASVYVLYHAVENEAAARLGMTRTGHTDTTGAPANNGDDPSGISLGMRVQF